LQFENKSMFSLSTDKKVNYSRPSIDVLFETAAWAVKEELLGILLTGSNNDGSYGLETIKKHRGTTIVQSPETSAARPMPENAIKRCQPDYIVDLKDIAKKVAELCK
ncbi:MAG TPA: chemotaxis protein CheB, partial [Prolixibacteraceae bacterium]|nr:chemotaxis protein CheB [Prolixibacteraceae bacterium]